MSAVKRSASTKIIALTRKRSLRTVAHYAGKENAPSRLRPRPTFRLTTAEATTTRRAINLRHSVLGASGTLWTGWQPVKHHSDGILRNLRPRAPVGPRVVRKSAPISFPGTPTSSIASSTGAGPQRNAPSRWRLRPAFRLTAAEAAADRRAINLGRSVLGASGNLGGVQMAVKESSSSLVANCDLFFSPRAGCASTTATPCPPAILRDAR